MYKIIGADGKAYGPVSLEQMRHWIAESRVNGQTQVQVDGSQEWKPLSTFPEFADAFSGPNAPVAPSIPAVQAAASRESAGNAVKAPAIALKVVAVLQIVFSVGAILLHALAMMGVQILPQLQNGDASSRFAAQLGSLSGILGSLFSAGLGVLIFVGASRFQALRSYSLAMTAAIVAMLPCSICCIVGLPIGIWALVVLNQPNVKSQFS